VYFFERSLQLLRVGGVLSFITSNKYMRAAYGEKLRTYLAYATHPHAILDFGDAPVFTSIAYPCILIAEKVRHVGYRQLPDPATFDQAGRVGQLLGEPDRTVRVHTWNPGKDVWDLPIAFEGQAHTLAHRDLKADGWRLERPASLRLLERLRQAGQPLGEYVQGRFYRGILTGLNKAFVVDCDTRDRLIAEHPSSAEVLKPFLRGRDVKRWRCEFAEQYLIRIESSENMPHPWSGKVHMEAERLFAKTYPAIHAWFQPMRQALINRYDQGQYFWELRSCDYWREFEQAKIVVPAIEDDVNYASDSGKYYSNDKTSILIPPSVPYTLAITNSAVSWWITRQQFASRQGGFYEFKPMYVSQLPIPAASTGKKRWCERLAEALIWLHGADASRMSGNAPIASMRAYFEQWLNGLVYELFLPDELHGRKLTLFAETARLNPPDLSTIPDPQKLTRLHELFEQAYDSHATLRSMLFSCVRSRWCASSRNLSCVAPPPRRTGSHE
jgi:adenine-specific DNA-methyltransferase